MNKYEVEITRRGRLTVEAESEEALNEYLFESDDDIFDTCIDRTDWEVLRVSEAKPVKKYRVRWKECMVAEVEATSEEEAYNKAVDSDAYGEGRSDYECEVLVDN
jgi:hypothetical protein